MKLFGMAISEREKSEVRQCRASCYPLGAGGSSRYLEYMTMPTNRRKGRFVLVIRSYRARTRGELKGCRWADIRRRWRSATRSSLLDSGTSGGEEAYLDQGYPRAEKERQDRCSKSQHDAKGHRRQPFHSLVFVEYGMIAAQSQESNWTVW